MKQENLTEEKLEARQNAVKIILGVLRAAVIINVIYYLVKLWAGQDIGPLALLPALVCIIIGAILYIYRRRKQ